MENKVIKDKILFEALCSKTGVSGFEADVCECFTDYLKDSVDVQFSDVMGNAYSIIEGNGDGEKIMIEAHADEIGFQVLNVSESGNIYLRRNGGIDEQCLPGMQVLVFTRNGEAVPGVIGKKPIHLMQQDDRKRTLEINQVWVDTGLDPSEVKSLVSVGDVVSVRPNLVWLGNNRVSGKALDNRVGMYVVARVMKRLAELGVPDDNTVVGVATVQEEVGSRGAVIASYRQNPDIAITVDLDFATDVPDCHPNKYGKVTLGGGVVIPINVDCDIALSRKFEQLAANCGIAHQLSARPHATGGTNISRMQIMREGIRTLSLGIPCRYMHTPVEMCDCRDIEAAIDLLVEFCKR